MALPSLFTTTIHQTQKLRHASNIEIIARIHKSKPEAKSSFVYLRIQTDEEFHGVASEVH